MSTYSADFEFNNFKNSLKSRGSRIVAIGDLAQQFEGFEAFGGGLGHPVLPVVRFVFHATHFEYAAIEPVVLGDVHPHHSTRAAARSRDLPRRRDGRESRRPESRSRRGR